MNRVKAQAIFACLLIFSSFIVGFTVAQTPPAANTLQHGEGVNMPTVTAQYGYFYGVTNITDRLFGDYSGLPLTGTTLDTGQGANELYDMDQNVLTTSDVEFNSVNAIEYFLDTDNITDVLAYPVTEASYVVWADNSTGTPVYYAKNGITGQIAFSGADAATVIQAAIDALGADGGSIYFKEGEYTLSAGLIARSTVEFIGAGPGRRVGELESKLKLANGVAANIITFQSTTNAVPISIPSVMHLHLDGNKAGGATGYGIYVPTLSQDGSAIKVYDLKIFNCWVGETSSHGVFINSNHNHWVANNAVETCGTIATDATIYYAGYANGYILNNYVAANVARGIVVANCESVVVLGNNINANSYRGIHLYNAIYCTVLGNVLYGNELAGADASGTVYIDGNSDYNTLTGNTIRKGTGNMNYGVTLGATSDNNVVSGNTLNGAATANIRNLGAGNIINSNPGYIAPGEERSASGSLTAGNANAICFSWNNPEAQDILIKKVVIEVTTGGGTVGSHLDVGIADDAAGTNRGTEFFDDLLLNNVQINDSWVAGDGGTQTKWVFCQDIASATDDWIVGQILDANAANLVGKYYIVYAGR